MIAMAWFAFGASLTLFVLEDRYKIDYQNLQEERKELKRLSEINEKYTRKARQYLLKKGCQ